MTNLNHYLNLDAVGIADGFRNGDFSPGEIMACAIQQKDKVEPDINSIAVDLAERALAQAKALDGKTLKGFQGLPFLLKDLSALANTQLTCGSRLFPATDSTTSSDIAQAYLDAGCLVLGKTNTPEFGLTITTEPVATGVCRNPWHTAYSTGGSSGGAAAAVAAGIVPIAHATDAGGSIRIPASCCGLYGLKPSRGLTVADCDNIAYQSGLTVNHVLSRTVRDSAHFLDLIKLEAGKNFPLPPTPEPFADAFMQSPGKLRLGIHLDHPFGETVDADVKAAVENTARQCESLGHRLDEYASSADYGVAAKAMNKILCAHAFQLVSSRLLALNTTIEKAEMETSTRQMAEAGSRITAADYVQALDDLSKVAEQAAKAHQDFDLILSPVLAKSTAKLGWLDMNSPNLKHYGERYRRYSGFAPFYNGSGQPSVSIPSLISAEGLPIGTMISGPWGSDLSLLQLSRQLEQQNPWPLLAPLASA